MGLDWADYVAIAGIVLVMFLVFAAVFWNEYI